MIERFQMEHGAIELDGLKVVSLERWDYYAGCCCETSSDRNRYDKESSTIVCKHYSECLRSLLEQAEPHEVQNLREYVKVIARLKGGESH